MASNKIGSTIEKTQEATKKLDDITPSQHKFEITGNCGNRTHAQ